MMGAALGTISGIHEVDYDAHFLQRSPLLRHEAASSGATSSERTKGSINRAESRRAERMVERLTAVADATDKPYLTLESLHPAPTNEQVQPELSTSSVSSASYPDTAPSAETRSSVASEQARSGPSPEAESLPSIVEAEAEPDVPADVSFPAFGRAMHPVSRVPDWGAMTTPQEWNRRYGELDDEHFTHTPTYDLRTLTIPMNTLLKERHAAETIAALTAKLYYSTRFFGAYDLDANEFSAIHPGIDLKLAEDTPIGAVAGGRVRDVRQNERSLGLYVIVEHRAPDGETYYSIYGHLGHASVRAGDDVTAGQMIGTVGMTGNTTGPHLHLQIDRGEPNEERHEVYWPENLPSRAEADRHTVNPIVFIRQFADGR